MKAKSIGQVGLFHVCYQIGVPKPGGQIFKVSLAVFTPGKTVNGTGHITQAVNPPLNLGTNLQGDYTYMCVMPRVCHILVTAEGYPIVHWPPHGGVGPVLMPNVHLRMVLSEDWKMGVANYSYCDSKGKWHEVTNAPVKAIPCNLITGD